MSFGNYYKNMIIMSEDINHTLFFIFNEIPTNINDDTSPLEHALSFLDYNLDNIYYDFFFPWTVIATGHSFGGYLAESVTIIRERIEHCESFNPMNNP